MKRTIGKFPLELVGEQVVQMPNGAQILCVQLQNGWPCIWALVDPTARLIERSITIVGTGHPFEASSIGSYIGTVQLETSGLVWHVFA